MCVPVAGDVEIMDPLISMEKSNILYPCRLSCLEPLLLLW